MYEAPKIGDLGQIAKHVFVNGAVFSPEEDGDFNGGQGAGAGAGTGIQASGATGAGMGLAGLSLIGALFAGLASRSSNESTAKKPSDVPTDAGRVAEP